MDCHLQVELLKSQVSQKNKEIKWLKEQLERSQNEVIRLTGEQKNVEELRSVLRKFLG